MSSPDIDQLKNDYNQLAKDRALRKKFLEHYRALFENLVAELKSGKIKPEEFLKAFMLRLMPDLVERTQYTLSIVSDQLNVLSDYRSLTAKAQSYFNKFSEGKGTAADYKKLKEVLKEIQEGLKLDGKDKNGDRTVLDASTKSEIEAALADLTNGKGTGKLDPPQSTPGSGDQKGANYLNGLWKKSKDPNDKTAAGIIKGITDEFNTINTGSSTVSQKTQTVIGYKSSELEQELGLANGTLQAYAKLFSGMVANQKTG